MPTFGINAFVRRHTPESRFSHFTGTDSELLALVAENFNRATRGPRDGMELVPVPAEGFFSTVVEVTPETQLRAQFGARAKGEAPYLYTTAVGMGKTPAKEVEIVCYRHDVLAEKGEATTDADWEIISINARVTEEPEPPHPIAMARNMLGLTGGTKAEYSAEEFVRAILYWATRTMVEPRG